MSRAIKFRGKSWEDGQWWYATPEDESWQQFWVMVDRQTVGQFTGLIDKHGKEIFEDDVVRADWHWEGPHVIVWPNDYYGFIEYGLDGENVEIIGNIYETSELLETPKGE